MSLDQRARTAKLSAARDLIRSATLADNDELFAFVNTLISACEFRSDATQILVDAASDIENLDHPPPELAGFDKRGEFDVFTRNVRHGHD